MVRRTFALALGAMLLVGVATQPAAAKQMKKPKVATITLMGCARQVPPGPPFCTIMSAGAQTYSLVGASPPVPVNVGVTVIGVKAGDASLCFATPLKVIKWSRNRLRCPL